MHWYNIYTHMYIRYLSYMVKNDVRCDISNIMILKETTPGFLDQMSGMVQRINSAAVFLIQLPADVQPGRQ